MVRRRAGNFPSICLQLIEMIGLIVNRVLVSGEFVPPPFLPRRKNLQFGFSVASVAS
jgi:hypothetical protein